MVMLNGLGSLRSADCEDGFERLDDTWILVVEVTGVLDEKLFY